MDEALEVPRNGVLFRQPNGRRLFDRRRGQREFFAAGVAHSGITKALSWPSYTRDKHLLPGQRQLLPRLLGGMACRKSKRQEDAAAAP